MLSTTASPIIIKSDNEITGEQKTARCAVITSSRGLSDVELKNVFREILLFSTSKYVLHDSSQPEGMLDFLIAN